MGVVRWYQSDRNPGESAFAGVPLGNIDDETWERLPPHVKNDVDNWTTVDGLKVYLKSYRTASEPEPVIEVKPKAKKPTSPPEDEPVAVPDVSEPLPEETPADEPSEEGAT